MERVNQTADYMNLTSSAVMKRAKVAFMVVAELQRFPEHKHRV